MLKLPRLTDQEFDLANSYIASSGQDPDICPTCGSVPDPEFPGERDFGVYKLNETIHECDCTTQLVLRRHYALARIPYQYMILDWSYYEGPKRVKEEVKKYLENFRFYKANGMGIEFYAVEQGVGKTFGAVHVGKELVKQGHKVLFMEFKDIVSGLSSKLTKDELRERLMSAHVLIIDEVKPGTTDAQRNLFAEQFETVVRYRTNWNMPTIITTNLTHEDLHNFYPRIYSLLSAKQHQIAMPGWDRRDNMIREENEYLAENHEVPPIT